MWIIHPPSWRVLLVPENLRKTIIPASKNELSVAWDPLLCQGCPALHSAWIQSWIQLSPCAGGKQSSAQECHGTGISLPPSHLYPPLERAESSSDTSAIPAPTLPLLLPAVNTDTETAVVNVTYATKEEAKL